MGNDGHGAPRALAGCGKTTLLIRQRVHHAQAASLHDAWAASLPSMPPMLQSSMHASSCAYFLLQQRTSKNRNMRTAFSTRFMQITL